MARFIFQRGSILGAFEFIIAPNYVYTPLRNEISIIGDGQGSILKSNGTTGYRVPDFSMTYNYPVVRLGFRKPEWMWARVAHLTIDGSYPTPTYRFSYGVVYDNANSFPWGVEASGRWIFDRVNFINCDRGVFKPSGNIGNHYIDCCWINNNYGVYANAYSDCSEECEGKMHNGCDRYSGGQFSGHSLAAIRYATDQRHLAGSGQIIIDGTVIQYNPGWAITMYLAEKVRMLGDAVSIRNVWFEGNGEGDLYLQGIRSVRIDDSHLVGRIQLKDSSVSLFNCRIDSDAGGIGGDSILVDETSSMVAYEHRYMSYPTSLIFVHSISYDGSQDINNQNWQPTSVWGPLRVVRSTKADIVVSAQFDVGNEVWNQYGTSAYACTSYLDPSVYLLGSGSNMLNLTGNNHIWSQDVWGILSSPGYYVWSIHTYLSETSEVDETQLHGEIILEDGYTSLGYVYFKKGQWACSYGMKYMAPDPVRVRLAFQSVNLPGGAQFYLTDFQVVKFDDLSGAVSFVNSREFAIMRQA